MGKNQAKGFAMSIPIDGHYIPAFSIEDVLLDKDTGAPLSGGLVYFYRDSQRGTPKPVWQITGTSPNYTFTQLPNPIVLSAIGTFEDSLDNPVIPYFYPFDAAGAVDLYYINVTNANGVPQFNREAQPYLPQTFSPVDEGSGFSNEISNPQFATVLFNQTSQSHTFSYTDPAGTVTAIAPDWDILVTGTGTVTVTVTQLTPQGTLNIDSNPGTILQISSSNASALQLRQRIFGSPNLWSGGNLSSSIVAAALSAGTPTIRMIYSQSNGTVVNELLLTAALDSAITYKSYPGQKKIDASTSLDSNPTAYIDIIIDLPVGFTIGITSIQIVFTGDTVIADVPYDQETNERQIDHLFHYYKPLLDYKPLKSYLVGWDFCLNPGQLGFSTASKAIGNNTSYYVADQTIVFQSITNSITTTLGDFLELTAVANTQMAIIQYLEFPEAFDLLIQLAIEGVSVNVNMTSTVSFPQNLTVSLWWTANANVPLFGTTSFVTALDANGHPSSVVAGWNELKYEFGPAQFTTTSTNAFKSFGFSNFVDPARNAFQTAKFFAIVIGSNTVVTGNTLFFNSVSLVPGLIPTIPAPQTSDEVLRQCQKYYQKSFFSSTTPVQNAGLNSGETYGVVTNTVTNFGPVVRFPSSLRTTPGAGTYYNPVAANALIRNITTGVDFISTTTAANTSSLNGFVITGTPDAGAGIGNLIAIHWSADARLGIV